MTKKKTPQDGKQGGEKVRRMRIKISSILNQLWPLDLAHWIYADQLHFRRVLQCAHQICVIMNHSIVTYMQCILAECVELLNMDGLQFPKRSLF